MLNFVFNLKPKVYGSLYLVLIPIYALIFFYLPDTLGQERTLVECIYFSAVTITTLGYGDITPSSDLGRIMASSESVFGVVLIGLFLNSLSRVRSETTRTEEIEKERRVYRAGQIAKLNGRFSLIKPLIGKHMLNIAQLTSPIANRSQAYNPDFTINDMKDLYGPSMLLTQDYHEPVVKYYFYSLERLNRELYDMIKEVDMSLFPELERHCLSFLEAIHSFDFSESILGATKTTLNGKPMTDAVKEMLENHEGKPEFLKSNIINGYVALYHQIKLHVGLVNLIKSEFKQLIGES